MKKYINSDMCKECGGICCKQNGCIYMPKDFSSINYNYMIRLLDEGNISIAGQPFTGFLNDAWSFLLYLRARNVDAPVVDLISSGGPCKMLTETGCSLKENKRPTLGLLVKPTIIGGPCEQKFTSDYLLNWSQYNDVLSRLVRYYTNKDVVDVIASESAKKIKIVREKIKNNEELSSMELKFISWYENMMANKPYYSLDEVKSLKLINLK